MSGLGGMEPNTEIALGCGCASALSILLNFAVIGYQKRNPKHAWFTDQPDSDGVDAQLWTYASSMANQAFVYPPCVFAAWLAWQYRNAAVVEAGGEALAFHWKPGGVFAIDGTGTEDVGLLPLRLYFYAFCGYLVRDMHMQMREPVWRFLMLLHHVVCIIGILMGLNTPTGGVAVALGTFTFEVGSFTCE